MQRDVRQLLLLPLHVAGAERLGVDETFTRPQDVTLVEEDSEAHLPRVHRASHQHRAARAAAASGREVEVNGWEVVVVGHTGHGP